MTEMSKREWPRCTSLLDQAAREILNQGVGEEFTNEADEYFSALAAADRGDYGLLTGRIEARPG